MRAVLDWSGRDVLDIGCGTGYHLPFFARDARSVVGVEPHPPLASLAAQRISGMPSVSVREDGAAAIGVADDSFDVAHARWAYFFGPGCEPGLAELDRVMRPGGAAFVIDNDATRSTFGQWFRRALPSYDPPGRRAVLAATGLGAPAARDPLGLRLARGLRGRRRHRVRPRARRPHPRRAPRRDRRRLRRQPLAPPLLRLRGCVLPPHPSKGHEPGPGLWPFDGSVGEVEGDVDDG